MIGDGKHNREIKMETKRIREGKKEGEKSQNNTKVKE